MANDIMPIKICIVEDNADMREGVAQLLNQATRFLWMTASESHELQSTARLLSTRLAARFLTRAGLLARGAERQFRKDFERLKQILES